MRKLITTIATAGLFSLATFTGAYAALADHAAQRAAVLAACAIGGDPGDCAAAKAAYEAVLAADPEISSADLLAELDIVAEEVLVAAEAVVAAACGAAGSAAACESALTALAPMAVAAGVPQEAVSEAVIALAEVANPEFAEIFLEVAPETGSVLPVPSQTIPG